MKKYTLLEMIAAMSIFAMMMTILFKTFTAAGDVAARESTKVAIFSDANVFLSYITNDIKSMIVEIYPAPENENGDKDDPDTAVSTAVIDYGEYQLEFDSTSIGFYANVAPYSDATLTSALAAIPSVTPYVKYSLNGGELKRTMAVDSALTNAVEGVILEGVKAFSIKVWDDYPGGSEVNSPAPSKPSCITISVTLEDNNPYKAQDLKDRDARTISKTIYLKR